MITQIIEGKDGISHQDFNRYPGRTQKVDDDHDTSVERLHDDVLDRRCHQFIRMMKQKVIVEFSDIVTNQTIDKTLFNFEIPLDADVLYE